MSLEVMRDKLMCFGASGKVGSVTGVGAFGVAAGLLLYSQSRYEVRSTGAALVGSFDKYDWAPDRVTAVGTEIEADLDCAATTLKHWLELWAEWTTTDCEIWLNGSRLKTYTFDGELRAQLDDWADIYRGPDTGLGGELAVRINGQLMHWVSGPAKLPCNLIVEVTGDSTIYFTSNRDGLQHEYRSALSAFVEKLYRDPTQLVELERGIVTTYPGKRGVLRLRKARARHGEEVEDVRARLAPVARMVEIADATAKVLGRVRTVAGDTEVTASSPQHGGFTLIVDNKIEGLDIDCDWLPGSMSKHAKTLMTRWIRLIMVCADVIGYDGPDLVAGWVFSTKALAMYQWHKDGCRILLNPVSIDQFGNMRNRFNLTRVADFLLLVEEAVHELTHAQGFSWHDEDFVTAFGKNMRLVMGSLDRVLAVRGR
jgi:hypothetical protein